MNNKAFVLPTIILIATTVMIILTAALQSVTTIRSNTVASYHQKLAEQAAEAGLTYAEACLKQNNRTQTWGGTKPNLTERSDCNGTITKPANIMLPENDTMRMSFSVGDVAVRNGNKDMLHILAIGKVELKKNASGTVLKTFTATLRRVNESQNNVKMFNADGRHTARLEDGKLTMWGMMPISYEGYRTYPTPTSFQPNANMKDVFITDLMLGMSRYSALSSEGKLYDWKHGSSWHFSGGIGTSENPHQKKYALEGKHAIAIGGGNGTVCALTSPENDGRVYCWGNHIGSYGEWNADNRNPRALAEIGDFHNNIGMPQGYVATKVSRSNDMDYNDHVCVLIEDGSLWCWGVNTSRQLGIPTVAHTEVVPVKAAFIASSPLGGKEIVDIQTSTGYTCVLTSDGQVYCWGDNGYGQLGIDRNNLDKTHIPQRINTGDMQNKVIKHLSVGYMNVCASDGSDIYCWGNFANRDDDGYTHPENVPTPRKIPAAPGVLAGKTIIRLTGGSWGRCAFTNNDTYCWGINSYIQVGNPAVTTHEVALPIESIFGKPDNTMKNVFTY